METKKIQKIYTCFPGGKHKVLTMSYDDGKVQDRRLVDIFNKNGIKGTFNINSGILNDDRRIPTSEYKELYKGHEVASHTWSHPTIERCPLPLIAQEVIEDRIALEKIMGYTVRGLAYPNGSYSKEIEDLLEGLGIRYGRVVGSTDDFKLPNNYMEWQATCHHNHNLIENGKKFLELKKKQYLYCMYVWGHSYEFDDKDNWELIEEFCEMMSGQDDIWYATNIEIVDYLDVVKNAQFSADGSFVHNPSFQSLWICVNDKEFIEIKGGETKSLL